MNQSKFKACIVKGQNVSSALSCDMKIECQESELGREELKRSPAVGDVVLSYQESATPKMHRRWLDRLKNPMFVFCAAVCALLLEGVVLTMFFEDWDGRTLRQLTDRYGSGSRETERFTRWVKELPVSDAAKRNLIQLSPAGEVWCGSCTLYGSDDIIKINQYLCVFRCGLVVVGSTCDGDFVVMRSLPEGFEVGFVPHDCGNFPNERECKPEVYFVRIAKDLEEFISLWNKEDADEPFYDFWNAIGPARKCMVFKDGAWSETQIPLSPQF